MKLFLSSYHLGNHPQELVRLFGNNKNVAVIMNAMDFVASDDRKISTNLEMSDLQNLGLKPKEIDLRDYFGKSTQLSKKLDKYGGVWVRGGNVFILRKAMSYSGLDKYLINKTNDKDFVYAGFSAGICVLSPTLKGLELVDQAETLVDKYEAKIIWEGINLLPYTLVPHYRSNHPESALIDNVVKYLEVNKMPYKTLSDGEVIVTEI